MDFTKLLSVTYFDTGEEMIYALRQPIRVCAQLDVVVDEENPITLKAKAKRYEPTPLDAQVEGPTVVEAIQVEYMEGKTADWLEPMPLHVFVGSDIQRKGRRCRWETMWADVSVMDKSGRLLA